MGPVWWKKCSSEILSLLKFHEMIFFGSLFWSTLKVIKFGFALDLGGIIQFCLGYRLGSWRVTTLHAWLRLYTAGLQHLCIGHHGEGGHQYLGHHRVPCGRPTAAALGKTTLETNRTRLQQQYQNNQTVFFWLRPPQAAHAPRRRELLAGPATSKPLTQLPRGFHIPLLPSRSWWWRLIAQPGVSDSRSCRGPRGVQNVGCVLFF